MRILIVEDNPVSRRKLEFALSKSGHDVVAARDGFQGWNALTSDAPPLLAILDISMPGLDGIEICRRVRQKQWHISPYLILLTARDSKEDVVKGLESGANDYIVKPFEYNELRARVNTGVEMIEIQRKLSNRVRELEEALSRVRQLQRLLKEDKHVYEFGPFRLEAAERRLLKEGHSLPIKPKIFDLLMLLVQNSPHLITKEEIMREIWSDSNVEENNLTVSMSTLRRILGESAGRPQFIETVQKHGYRFVASVRISSPVAVR